VLIRCSLLLFLALAFILPSQASAQGQGPWATICVDEQKRDTCRIKQELFLNQEVDGKTQNVGRILALTVLKVTEGDPSVRNAYLSLEMPLGVDLRPGAVVRVDEGPEIPIPYLQCTQAGCAASIFLGPEVLLAFRAGNVLSVGFRPWGSSQVQAVQASLTGFTRAFAGIR
jgi:invasion protein IalB